jgi:antitoxin HicB
LVHLCQINLCIKIFVLTKYFLGVFQAMTEQGIKKAELSRRLGWQMSQARCLFDLRHASKLEQIEVTTLVLAGLKEVRVAA